MSDKILVLGANKWSMKGTDGSQFSGISCHYVETYDVTDSGKRGLVPMKCSCTDGVFDALVKAPCFVDAEFGRRPGKGGKAETYLKAVKVLKTLDLLGSPA